MNSLPKEEQDALHSLRDDPSIIIIGANKGSAIVVWDREDYLMEAYRQLHDKEVYKQVPDDPSVFANNLMKKEKLFRKNKSVGEIFWKGTLDYYLVKDPKFSRFFLLLEIDKRLHDVSGRPVISNCGYYSENISSFLGSSVATTRLESQIVY